MAQTIKLKRSGTQNAVPSTSQLELGEVAINTYDGKMYIKKNDGSDSIVEIGGDATSSSGLDFTGNLNLADNVRIVIGDGNDLQIYHDGSNSYIDDAGTGDLYIRANNLRLSNADGSGQTINTNNGGNVELFHNNSKKFETTSAGVTVTGQLNATTMHLPDGSTGLQLGSSNDTKFFHDGNNSKITHSGSGGLYIGANTFAIQKGDHSENYLAGFADGTVEIYHNGVKKFETTSTGITVTGVTTSSGLNITNTSSFSATATFADGAEVRLGADNDMGLFHSSGVSHIRVNSGTFKLRADDMRFTAQNGTTEFARFESNGNLGIGTTSPGGPLHVKSSSNKTLILDATITGSSLTSLAFQRSGADKWRILQQANDSHLLFYNDINSINQLSLAANGNVGIGTISPSSVLTVDSGTVDDAYTPTDFNNKAQIKIDVASTQNNYAGIQFTHSGNTEGFIGLVRPSSTNAEADFVIQGYSSDISAYTEKMRITDAGKVGIGTASPGGKLHVHDGNLVIQTISGSGGRYLSLNNAHTGGRDYRLISTNDSHGSLGGGDFAILDGNVSGNDAAKTRLLIDSSGQVLIGTTLNVFGGADRYGYNFFANGQSNQSIDGTSGAVVQYINRENADGAFTKFHKDRSELGSIFNSGTTMGVGSLDTGLLLANNIDAILPWNASTNAERDNAIDLGRLSGRFKNFYLSGTIYGGSTLTLDPAAHGDDTGTVVIAGNLQVDGTTTTINSTTLTVDDKNITLASGSTNKAAANGAGITVDCGSDTDATFTYNGTDDKWEFNKPLQVNGNIANVSGDMTLDVAGDIILDADGGDVILKDGGTFYGFLAKSGNDFVLKSQISDGDFVIKGSDAGSTITALRFDMSDGGGAYFNNDIYISDSQAIRFGTDQDFRIYSDGSNTYLVNSVLNQDLYIQGRDSSALYNMLTMDMSARKSTFGGTVSSPTGFERGDMFITQNEIDVSSGNLTLDVAGDIILDADGGDILLKDGGTHWASVYTNGTNTYIQNMVNSGDVYLSGKDGSGNGVNALILDMSAAGAATFNAGATFNSSVLASNGSASAPAYSFSNDTDTGMFLNGVGYLGLSVAGSKQLELGGGVIYTATNGKIRSGANAGSLELSGGGATVGGQILLNGGTSDANIIFKTGADTSTPSERMRIDSSGNVLVGTQASAVQNFSSGSGTQISDGYIAVARGGSLALLNRISTDGDIIEFKKDGSLIGSIGVDNGDNLTISGNSSHAGLNFSSSDIIPYKNGSYIDNNISLGYSASGSNYRFKDFYLSGNIQMGGNLDVVGQIGAYNNPSSSWGTMNFRATDYIFKNSGGTTKMSLDASGRVGIGQTPLANNFALQVTGLGGASNDARAVYLKGSGNHTSIGSTGPTLVLQNTNSTANNIVKLSFESASSGETVSINAINTNHSSHYGDMAFNTRGSSGYSEKMRIMANGNVGIGTHSPSKPLTISGADAEFLINRTGSYADTITMGMPGGVPTIVGGTDLAFGGTGTWTEHMRIKADGNVGIGTSSPYSGTNVRSLTVNAPSYPALALQIGGNNAGLLMSNSSGTDFYSLGNKRIRLITNDTTRIRIAGTGGVTFNEEYTFPTEDGSANQVLKTDGSGNLSFVTIAGAGAITEIEDADGDTKIQVEEGTDDDTIRFDTAGTERMLINASGNVGIGTPSPASQLHMKHASGPTLTMTRTSTNTSGSIGEIIFGNGDWDSSMASIRAIQDGTNDGGKLEFKTQYDATGGEQTRLIIKRDGNVGIGTTSPSKKLHIKDSAAHQLQLQGSNSYWNIGTGWSGYYQDYLLFATNTGEKMVIDNTGKVGIGTNAPARPFHIVSTAGTVPTVSGIGLIALVQNNSATDSSSGVGILSGNAANGSIFFGDAEDADIGKIVYEHNNNALAITTNATERMRIDSSGRVGIGTASPTMPLSVQAASNAYAISMHGRSDGYSELYGASNDGSTKYAFLQTHSAQTKLYTLVNTPLLFGTNSTERMRIDSGGALFIGSGHSTSSPSDGVIAAAYASGYNNAGGDLELYGGRSTGDNAGGEIRFFTGAAGSSGTQINAHTRRMTIDADGKVGIGTASPDQLLHIEKTAGTTLVKTEVAANSTVGFEIAKTGSTTQSWRIVDGQTVNGVLEFYDVTDSATRMAINGSGNVGIGTSSPSQKLHIFGNALYITDGTYGGFLGKGNTVFSAGAADDLALRSQAGLKLGAGGNNIHMTITTGGNVGIGTSSPQAKLQVEELGIDTTTTTTSATTQVAIDTMAAATFRSAEFTIQVTNSTDSTYHLTKVLLIHDGTTPGITEYGTVFTGSAAEATFDADISSGNVRLLATPASTDSMTFKVVRHCITV